MKIIKKLIALRHTIYVLSLIFTSVSIATTIDNTPLYPSENADYYLNDVGVAQHGSDDYGCHSQAIKFDGTRFYTTCMDTEGNNSAHLYVHDQNGHLIKDYEYDNKYEHPSGILLYKGWAYTGITSNGINMYSKLFRFNGDGDVEYQGYSSHSVGFVGAKFVDPDEPEFEVKTRYYSYDMYYERQCKNTDGRCDSYRDIKTKTDINAAGDDGVQDCDYYYLGNQWYKACILFSSQPINIRVWHGDELVLSPQNAITTLTMDGQPGHSGGLGFYTDPNGTKWIVTTPPAQCNGRACGGCIAVGKYVCACTDRQNRQRVRFYRFNNLMWPGAD